MPVLHGLDFEVDDGEVVVLLGANGAGKTTTLRAVCGMVDVKGGRTSTGAESSDDRRSGSSARAWATCLRAAGTFPELTVEENLEAGAFVRQRPRRVRSDIEHWFESVPAAR